MNWKAIYEIQKLFIKCTQQRSLFLLNELQWAHSTEHTTHMDIIENIYIVTKAENVMSIYKEEKTFMHSKNKSYGT